MMSCRILPQVHLSGSLSGTLTKMGKPYTGSFLTAFDAIISRETQYKERSSIMSNTKTVQTGYAEINGITLYYEVAGAGHPFVLVHGHLLDRKSWDDQFAVFAQRYR